MLVFAIIVAVPAFHAVTFPPETDATELLLLLQDTDLFVALEGLIVAANEKNTLGKRNIFTIQRHTTDYYSFS